MQRASAYRSSRSLSCLRACSIPATRSAARKDFKLFSAASRLVGIDDAITRVFGRERGRLRAQGKTVGDFDLLIGATALHHGVAVLTNNRRHFELIETLQIISL